MIGRDQIVRGAVLTVITNGVKSRISRPLTKLIPLEISNKGDDSESEQSNNSENLKSRRTAFLNGQLIRQLKDNIMT